MNNKNAVTGIGCLFVAVWGISAILSIGLVGVIIWGIYHVVTELVIK